MHRKEALAITVEEAAAAAENSILVNYSTRPVASGASATLSRFLRGQRNSPAS